MSLLTRFPHSHLNQEEEEAEVPAAQRKPTKIPPETTPSTPAPVAASAIHEEEDDEGDKIMAELQVRPIHPTAAVHLLPHTHTSYYTILY